MRVLVLLCAASLACSPAATATTGTDDRPHIVLVMSDDQGWGDVAYNGHPLLETPNLDSAAASGLRFDRFYAAAPGCSPTRASVLTGRHPNRMGVLRWGHSIRPQEVTLAEALSSAGYATGHFGKWHLGSVRSGSPDNPENSGFDEWFSAPNYYDDDAVMSHRGRAVETEGESSQVTVDAALAWIERALDGGRPIFAVVWFASPHAPHVARQKDRSLYADQTEELQLFYGEITAMDRAFGHLRRELTELGIKDDTLLWFCSDNGAQVEVGSTGGHRGNKGEFYEGGLLVPAFVEWPARIDRPRTTGARSSTSDIYPTLLELTGTSVARQPPLDGVSLASLFEGAELAPRTMGFWGTVARGVSTPSEERMDALLAAQQEGRDLDPPERSLQAGRLPATPHPLDSFPGHAAWLEGDLKLHRIQNKGIVRFELYDLATDPFEKSNLFTPDSEVATRLRLALGPWLASVARSYNGADYDETDVLGGGG